MKDYSEDQTLKQLKESWKGFQEQEDVFGSQYNIDNYVSDKFIEVSEIVEENLEEKEDSVEGTQRDVDDWDMHYVIILEGSVIARGSLPFPQPVAQQFVEKFGDINEETMNAYFKEGVITSDWLDTFIENKIPKAGGMSIPQYSENLEDDVNVLSVNYDGQTLTLTIKVDIYLEEMEDEPYYRGTYRTGGEYPDY